MKMKILTDTGEKEIELKMKGRHSEKVWKKMSELAKIAKDDPAAAEKIIDYRRFLEEIAAEISGMTTDQLNELDIEEKHKIMHYLETKVTDEVNFLRP